MNTITVKKRDPKTKAKQLRRFGIVPCVVYGGKLKESLSVQIDQGTARQLQRKSRNGSKVNVEFDGQIIASLIKDLEYNSLNNEVTHISFQALDDDKKVNSVADIVLLNKDKVTGVLEQMQMKVFHSALPKDLIDIVTVDLADLPIGAVITVGDIPAFQSSKIDLQTAADSIVLRINDKKRADYSGNYSTDTSTF